jgi:hypothetical protein
VIDMHHHDELFADPAGQRDRFLAMWEQISERLADRPDVQVSLLTQYLAPAHVKGELAATLDAHDIERARRMAEGCRLRLVE